MICPIVNLRKDHYQSGLEIVSVSVTLTNEKWEPTSV